MEEKQYAGFWIRFGASLIDLAILYVVVYFPLSLIYGPSYWESEKFVQGFWDLILGNILPVVATIWFWQTYLGTPGKMVLKLRIVDAETGKTPSLGHSILRYIGYIPSCLFLFLGLLWVAFDDRKQGWHDKMAGTVVLRR